MNIELYKIAYSRLQFQDEYLFKFSAVFLTVEGALGALVRTSLDDKACSFWVLLFASMLGLALSVIWWLWIYQNDYWHSVWIGTLKNLEANLPEEARLFNQDHLKLAKAGGRNGRFKFNGHCIALAMPAVLGVLWGILLAALFVG